MLLTHCVKQSITNLQYKVTVLLNILAVTKIKLILYILAYSNLFVLG